MEVEQQQPIVGEEEMDVQQQPQVPLVDRFKLYFDPIIVLGLVFQKCDSDDCNKQNFCSSCIRRNRYLTFAYFQPFPFQAILPTKLFLEFFPGYSLRQVTTMEEHALKYAGIVYFNVLFDPTTPFMYQDEEWHQKVVGLRDRASLLWGDVKEFEAQLCAARSELELTNLMEKRLLLGESICALVNGKELAKPLKEWVDHQYELFGSLELVPWKFNRCKRDILDQIDRNVMELNKLKQKLMDELNSQK